MEEQKRKVGRPRKHPVEQGRRLNITFRACDEIHDRLKAAAAVNQRSLSEEIEARVIASFETPDLLNAIRDTIRAELKG